MMLETDIATSLTDIFGAHDGPWTLYSARDNYVFTTTKRLAKVAYKPGGDERLATGVRIASDLSKAGLPVVAPLLPYPVREKFGLMTLWPLLENEPVESYELDGPVAMAFGEALARLSQVSIMAPAWNPFTRVEPRLAISSFPSVVITRARAITDRMRAAVSELRAETFSHGDAHPANALFFSDGTLSLIDFDYATMSPAGWDIACLWVSMVFENDNQEGFDAARKSYETSGGVHYSDLEILSMLRVLLGTTFQMTLPASTENLEEVDYRLNMVDDWLSQ